MTKYFYVLLIFLCCACSKGKYYITNVFRKGTSDKMKSLQLDSTYQFYLRRVYRDKNRQMENVLKVNLENKDTANKTLIEVEYLLFSWVHRNAVYISTIPDKFQRYYSNHFADTLINAYDFSTFHFGKIAPDGESILFTSKDLKKNVTWDIRPFISNTFPDKLSIREIVVQQKDIVENVILLNKALEEPVSFTRQNNYTIIFEKPNRKADACDDIFTLCSLWGNKIYFDQDRRGVDIYFRFNKNIGDSKDSAIRFDYKRTRYPFVQ
jgi:hypothetical protein